MSEVDQYSDIIKDQNFSKEQVPLVSSQAMTEKAPHGTPGTAKS